MEMPTIKINDGTVEGLKWLALLLMIGDHINKYLFNSTLPFLFEAGRLAMPLFGFILAYNLARPNTENDVYIRTIKRLAIFGIITTPVFIGLGNIDGWWPLNILFTLLVATAVIYGLKVGRAASYCLAAATFLIGGALVEYWWPAVGFIVFSWLYIKKPSILTAVGTVISCTLLVTINSNYYALTIVPVLFLASTINLNFPRIKWFFYAFYPLHLILLWLIRIPMSKAGYLFFT